MRMRVFMLFAALLLHLYLPRASCNCATYGCTPSLSFTCPTDFYQGAFNADLAMSYEDADLKPSGAGCVTNDGNVVCPMVGQNSKYVLMSWDVNASYKSWNKTTKALSTLPAIDTFGTIYTTDGEELCKLDSNGVPPAPCIKMEPITGPLFDITIVADKFIYLLYKNGFMVAYTTDGIAYASIWLNGTVQNVGNGTFIPIANPAVSGERVYILTSFKSFKPNPSGVLLRVFALDVRTIMVERIKIIWYYDVYLPNSALSIDQSDHSYSGGDMESAPQNIMCVRGTVLASVNYATKSDAGSNSTGKQQDIRNSLLVSLQDHGDSYTLNFIKDKIQPFHAMAYASPNFNVTTLDSSDPPLVWISLIESDSISVIRKVDATTGNEILKINQSSLSEITMTSKMSIFYNDQDTGEKLRPLVFGYSYKTQTYVTAIDVSLKDPEIRFSVSLPKAAPAVGQITTVGTGRDTMMVVTTTEGVYFYVLFADILY